MCCEIIVSLLDFGALQVIVFLTVLNNSGPKVFLANPLQAQAEPGMPAVVRRLDFELEVEAIETFWVVFRIQRRFSNSGDVFPTQPVVFPTQRVGFPASQAMTEVPVMETGALADRLFPADKMEEPGMEAHRNYCISSECFFSIWGMSRTTQT